MKKFLLFLMGLFIPMTLFSQGTFFAPYEGWSSGPMTVTISNTPTSVIYYTTDGSEPTLNSPSATNSVEVPISTQTTFKAFAVRNGTPTPVETMTYYIGSYSMPKAFLKPPSSWNLSCGNRAIVEPRTLLDLDMSGGPVMDDACEGWKTVPIPFAVGYISFNNCIPWSQNYQSTPGFLFSENIFYDYSNGMITNPPACLLNSSEIQGKVAAIKVFPNPVQEFLKISSDIKFSGYEILDESGRILSQSQLEGNNINVSKLKSGVYYLRLKSSEKVNHYLRFIKK